MGLRRALATGLLTLLWAAAATSPAVGQEEVGSPEEVVRVDLTAAVLPSGDARVQIIYTLAGGVHGDSVPATLLAFGETSPADLTLVTPGERPRPVPLLPGPLRQYTASLTLTDDGRGGTMIVVRYRTGTSVVRDGAALRVHVPVLSVDRPPRDSEPDFFAGRVTVPGIWAVSETFPTGMTLREEVGDSAVYTVLLPVLPATLSLRAHEDGRWHPGLPLLLDVLTVLVVVGFSLMGWRHLRQEVS